MRVCILTDYYYPQLGGITEHVHGQAANLAARGHEVTIVTGRVRFFMLAPFALPAGTAAIGTYHSVFTPGRLRDLVREPTRAALRRLHGHVVVSEACIPPLDHYFPELDWRVIPNGIDEDHFTPDAEPLVELRASGDPVVLFLGRFDPRNGLGIMLEAFARLLHEREGHARLVVVGDGPLRRYYQSRLEPSVARQVHWAGRIDWNRPRYYASADVFCTPCQRASFGMVLLEAMSCGRPVVASLIPGFETLITSGRQGFLVSPPDAPEAFAAALAHLLESPAERRRMGAEGRATATAGYSWPRVAGELEAYYREVRGDSPVDLGSKARSEAASPV